MRSVIYRAVALQYLTVFLGFIWWSTEKMYQSAYGFQLTNGTIPAIASAIMLSISAYWRKTKVPRRKPSLVPSGLAGYAILLILCDPFLEGTEVAVFALINVALVLPPMLCLSSLIRSEEWLAVCGDVLFSSASVACLLSNGRMNFGGLAYGVYSY